MGENRDQAVSSAAPKADNTLSRRTFAIGVGSTVALLGLGALKFVPAEALVRPPGGQDEATLLSKCTHCNRCVGACPYDIIKPQELDRGLVGMRLPYMQFSRNTPGVLDSLQYCDFCVRENGGTPRCVHVCPTGALSQDGLTADNYKLGVAVIDANLCMAYRSGYCAYCHDACEIARGADKAAITYVGSADDQSRLPVVNADLCNGCGACESVCVSIQAGSTRDVRERAIVIRPLSA